MAAYEIIPINITYKKDYTEMNNLHVDLQLEGSF